MKLLEESIFNVQEKYQDDQMDIDDDECHSLSYELTRSTDLLFDIHNEEPIGHFVIWESDLGGLLAGLE